RDPRASLPGGGQPRAPRDRHGPQRRARDLPARALRHPDRGPGGGRGACGAPAQPGAPRPPAAPAAEVTGALREAPTPPGGRSDTAPRESHEPGPARAADAILEGLNPEQLEAVTHGEGPLLIVAGAGTGKTAVITRRIAWLIATKGARPEEILALTFTDKAAAEMESRVDVMVPYGLVGATISTFHSFCDRLVRQHAVELGVTAQLRVESRAEILVFLRERLFELGLRRYLPLGHPDHHLDAMLTLFDRARDEDVPP